MRSPAEIRLCRPLPISSIPLCASFLDLGPRISRLILNVAKGVLGRYTGLKLRHRPLVGNSMMTSRYQNEYEIVLADLPLAGLSSWL